MNIYLIQEDGESGCWQAKNMAEATRLAEDRFIAENYPDTDFDNEAEARSYYNTNIIQSCQFVEELKNPTLEAYQC